MFDDRIKYAPVAQLDRALDSDSKGRWFDSSRAYQEASAVLAGAFLMQGEPAAFPMNPVRKAEWWAKPKLRWFDSSRAYQEASAALAGAFLRAVFNDRFSKIEELFLPFYITLWYNNN